MKKNMKIFNWDKEKTLYRYLKAGDIFCYQIATDIFGYGRFIIKNKWGGTAELFDFFTEKPAEGFDYDNVNNYKNLFTCIVDYQTLFVSKMRSDWRIIAQDPNYVNPEPNKITCVCTMLGIAYNADYSYSENIGRDEALRRVRANYELSETQHGHYLILSLLILYKPDLFKNKSSDFVGFDDFIAKKFEEIHNE